MQILNKKQARLNPNKELNKNIKLMKIESLLDITNEPIIQHKLGFIYENEENDFFFPRKTRFLTKTSSFNNFRLFTNKLSSLSKNLAFFHLMYFLKQNQNPFVLLSPLGSSNILNKKKSKKSTFPHQFFSFSLFGKTVKLHAKDIFNFAFRLNRSKKLSICLELGDNKSVPVFFNIKNRTALNLSRQIILKY